MWISTPKPAVLTFIKEAEGLAVHAMADLVDRSISMPAFASANGAFYRIRQVAERPVVQTRLAHVAEPRTLVSGAKNTRNRKCFGDGITRSVWR